MRNGRVLYLAPGLWRGSAQKLHFGGRLAVDGTVPLGGGEDNLVAAERSVGGGISEERCADSGAMYGRISLREARGMV